MKIQFKQNKMGKINKLIVGALVFGVLSVGCAAGCAGRAERERYLNEFFPEGDFSQKSWKDLASRIKYDESTKFQWKSAYEGIKQGRGTCKEYAIISSAHSGGRYGNNILILYGSIKMSGESIAHVVHLLKENDKYGFRDNGENNLEPKHSLEEVINNIRTKLWHVDFDGYKIINLDEMHKDWKWTWENLVPYYSEAKNRAKTVNLPDLD